MKKARRSPGTSKRLKDGTEMMDHDDHQHQGNPKSNLKSKPMLKLVGKAPATKLHLGADPPSADFHPGEYLAKCVNAWIELWRGILRAVWQFEICDGPHHGVGIRKWKNFDLSGEVSRKSEYARACAIALGRPLEETDDINDPASIFAGSASSFSSAIGKRKDRAAGELRTSWRSSKRVRMTS